MATKKIALMAPDERKKHVYPSVDFEEIVLDTLRFFNGTPVRQFPLENFKGTGVYALYYIGQFEHYRNYHRINRVEYKLPIYIGKAVPTGWRQGRVDNVSAKLFSRINQHARGIASTNNLSIDDFRCRFMILEDKATTLISVVESALINLYKPLWNTGIDGFGNHDPGGGRRAQAKSSWDVLHMGRSWAQKQTGEKHKVENVVEKISNYFKSLKNG